MPYSIVTKSLIFTACLLLGLANPVIGEDEYTIRLKSRTIQPEAELADTAEMFSKIVDEGGDETSERHMIIQFNRKLKNDDFDQIEDAGVSILQSLGGKAYLTKIETRKLNVAVLEATPIRAMINLESTDKLSKSLAEGKPLDYAMKLEEDALALLVSFHQDVTREAARKSLSTLDIEGRYHGADNSWEVVTSLENANALAALDAVMWIEEGPLPFLELNEGARRSANTDARHLIDFSNSMPQFNGVSGSGVRVGICEGFDENHDDFKTVLADGSIGATRVYRTMPGGASHGTHVASIAGGNGFNSAANGFPAFSLRGHAPEAMLGDYPSFGGDANRFYEAIEDESTDVTNHSYVQTRNGGYDSRAASLDSIVRGDGQDSSGSLISARPQVWASGNNGTRRQYGNMVGFYSTFTSAKNTISVGSIDVLGNRTSDFSGLGPTYDGRIKPDIVAPGCYDSVTTGAKKILAARNGTQAYTGKCGTSMAAPCVTGIVGLMRSQYARSVSSSRLIPSTYKAILIHSAIDMEKTGDYRDREFLNPDTGDELVFHAGPDYINGYGLVNADGACDLISSPNQWREPTIATTGSEQTYCVRVPDGTSELKIVIAWDDEPGSTLTAETASKLVNDLDLELIDPAGNKHLPWVLDTLPVEANPGQTGDDPITTADIRPAYKAEDHRNNVEMATVCRPASGNWTIRIRAHDLPNGNPQSYSLVSSLPLQVCSDDLSDLAPWICNSESGNPFSRSQDEFVVDPRGQVPVDTICRYIRNCPACAQAQCPNWEMVISGVPENSTVHVASQRGVQKSYDIGSDGVARVKFENVNIEDQLVLLFTKRGDISSPLVDSFRCRVKAVRDSNSIASSILQESSQVISSSDLELEASDVTIKSALENHESVFGLVVMNRQIGQADRARLKMEGVELGGFLGKNAYEAAFTKPYLNHSELGMLRFARPFEVADKVESELLEGQTPAWAKMETGGIKVSVFFSGKPEDNTVREVFLKHTDQFEKNRLEDGRWEAVLTAEQIRKLAESIEVRSIELGPDPSNPLDDGCCGF